MSEFNINTSYDTVGDFIDTVDDISPFDVIKSLANKMGQTVKDPNPSCKKCHGRGYVGRHHDTKAPVPCQCIFPEFDTTENRKVSESMRKPTRAERRKQQRMEDKQRKKMTKQINKGNM